MSKSKWKWKWKKVNQIKLNEKINSDGDNKFVIIWDEGGLLGNWKEGNSSCSGDGQTDFYRINRRRAIEGIKIERERG